ncbi:MAG: molecular chaperone DnaJ [Polyangiaceae bacterium]|nr:molecular chaperone DnaJ [Polyangiaceae bacterium]
MRDPSPLGFEGLGGLQRLLEALLGGFGAARDARAPRAQERLRLTFEEAARGCKKRIDYQALDSCGHCGGTGAEPGSRTAPCTACSGTGRVQADSLFPTVEYSCRYCHGTGVHLHTECTRCAGSGVTLQSRTVTLAVPAGIENGAIRRIRQAGHRLAPTLERGHLEVTVEVASHPSFRREGYHIACKVPVSFATAVLGGCVRVRTLDGEVTVRVPARTQPGSTIVLHGRGLPRRFPGGRGDFLVRVNVRVPERLTPRAREIVEQFEREVTNEPGIVDPPSWLGRLRGWLL